MSKKECRNEVRYQIAMHYARKLLEQGHISDRVYTVYQVEMRKKYCPVIGTLFTEITAEKA